MWLVLCRGPVCTNLRRGARVQDAIDAAGGLLAQAMVDSINLAALLKDGQQLVIPYQDGREVSTAGGEDGVELPSSGEPEPSSPGDSSSDLPSSGPDTTTGDPNVELVNINTASLDELNTLPGIGPTIAQRIIDYRNENGVFSTIEDIMNVSGIGVTTFEEIKELITT